ncbi:glycosyltransferase [Cereibacter sphaeroides]|uniref:glycosyltransferase n=1 Tax=Cereibacter sphaeroides TaxID=1063 RepID=UPI001F3100EF|nr:glycosyltransferase [Cereibacter sphaeroides]MCE6970520.1 glycosyltransferase [Cereibacter sphaeroides]
MTGPIRIGFFLPHLRHGGAERVVLLLLRHLDRERFRPVLILQRREGEYLKLLPPDVEVIVLRRPRPPACVPELARLLRDARIDVLYSATNATNIYAATAARLGGGRTRVVISEHTPLDYSLSTAKLLAVRRFGIRRAYPLADLMVAPLDRIGDEMRDYLGAAAPPFRCLPNPVVDSVAPPRDQPVTALRIVSVGRLAAVKRFDLLIEAFAAFHSRQPAASLTIFGDGPERAALDRLVARLGLGSAVAFAGYVEDVQSRLAAFDLFVCTSEREGFGNAIVEAMAAGVPVLSVDCPFGPRLLLQDGRTGRLVAVADTPSVARAMTEIAEDQPARQRYARAARDVAASFSVARAVAAHEQVFAAVAAKASASSRQEGETDGSHDRNARV